MIRQRPSWLIASSVQARGLKRLSIEEPRSSLKAQRASAPATAREIQSPKSPKGALMREKTASDQPESVAAAAARRIFLARRRASESAWRCSGERGELGGGVEMEDYRPGRSVG